MVIFSGPQHAKKSGGSGDEGDDSPYAAGELALEGFNQGMGAFVPDLFFEQLTKNFARVRHIYGERLVRLLTGFDSSQIERNARYPEFRKMLREALRQRHDQLKDQDIFSEQNALTEEAVRLAALELLARADVEQAGARSAVRGAEGDATGHRQYRTGDTYRDVDVKASVRSIIRKGKKKMDLDDLHVAVRSRHQGAQIMFALDASVSMRGDKIGISKQAGVALAAHAAAHKDRVGVVVFAQDVQSCTGPTLQVKDVAQHLARASPAGQTDIARMLYEVADVFTSSRKKHIVVITDALPTVGSPQEVVDAVIFLAKSKISTSVVGIDLDDAGEKLAQDMVSVGNGRLYVVKNVGDIPTLVLKDYQAL